MGEKKQIVSIVLPESLAHKSRVLAAMQGQSRLAFIAEATREAIRKIESGGRQTQAQAGGGGDDG